MRLWSIATTASVTVLAFVTVCLRLLARYERMQKLWWDNHAIVIQWSERVELTIEKMTI
jgi:hypothetical protein